MIVQVLFATFTLFNCWNVASTETITVLDPWVLADREAVSIALLNCTDIPAVFGKDNLGNLLWGIQIQTHWQIISGRQQSQPLSVRIDEDSWWANVNYFLTIVPYLVAMNCKLLPATTKFLIPQSNTASNYPIVYANIDVALAREWTNYFEAIERLRSDPTNMTVASLQQILWVAHNATVANAVVQFVPELNLLNRKEKEFANGFAHLVEVLAILNFDTSYSVTNFSSQMLPQRKLKFWDVPPFILDMTPQQNIVIKSLFGVSDMTKVDSIWKGFLKSLRIGMSTAKCAENLTRTVAGFFKNPQGNFASLLTNILASC